MLKPKIWTACRVVDDIEILWVIHTFNGGELFTCCVYHSPKPVYRAQDLLLVLQEAVDEIQQSNPDAYIPIAGDFNQLSIKNVDQTGLVPVEKKATCGRNILDQIYTSNLKYEHIKVVKSTIRSDHMCVIAYAKDVIQSSGKRSLKCTFKKQRRQ